MHTHTHTHKPEAQRQQFAVNGMVLGWSASFYDFTSISSQLCARVPFDRINSMIESNLMFYWCLFYWIKRIRGRAMVLLVYACTCVQVKLCVSWNFTAPNPKMRYISSSAIPSESVLLCIINTPSIFHCCGGRCLSFHNFWCADETSLFFLVYSVLGISERSARC